MSKASEKAASVQLVNECVLTQKNFYAYARETFYRFQKKLRAISALLLLLFWALAACCLFWWNMIPLGVISILFGGYFLFMLFWGYVYSATASYRNLEEFYGKPIQMKVLFYDSYFRVETSKGSNEFLYSQISHLIMKKDLSILIVGSKGIISHGQVIDLNAFTEEERQQYLELAASFKTCNL